MKNNHLQLVNQDIEVRPKKNYLKKLIIALSTLIFLGLVAVFVISGYVGWNLTHPVRQAIGSTPASFNLSYEEVAFPSRIDKIQLKGWLIKAPGSKKTVIFAHGYRKNRLHKEVPILPIAQKLQAQGYDILMFDFRNSGESKGQITSVGQFEERDLLGAVDFINSRSDVNHKIILYGFSMGASTAIDAGAKEPSVAAVVADSPFADLKSYLNKNLSVWTDLPSFPFNQAFMVTVPALTGLEPDNVSPVRAVTGLNGRPLLLITGTRDVDVPIENSQEIVRAYPKAQLYIVPGAAHIKGYATAGNEYINRVTDFLNLI